MKNQIEEMAKEICNATQKTNQGCNSICYPRGMCAHCKVMAEHLYNAGYRKSSDVAEKIFAEVEKFTYRYLNDADYSGGDLIYDLAELKKKYTEGGK